MAFHFLGEKFSILELLETDIFFREANELFCFGFLVHIHESHPSIVGLILELWLHVCLWVRARHLSLSNVEWPRIAPEVTTQMIYHKHNHEKEYQQTIYLSISISVPDHGGLWLDSLLYWQLKCRVVASVRVVLLGIESRCLTQYQIIKWLFTFILLW